MASVLQFKLPISHPNSSSSSVTSSSSLKSSVPCYKQFQQRNLKNLCKKIINCKAVAYAPESTTSTPKTIANLKLKLLSAVSGLNRGLAASEDDLRNADSSAKELEEIGGPVDLTADLDKLQGRWKLIYSSAFSSRTLGGSRPGPPTGRLLPITLGQVFQRIDIFSKDFDNIVELELGAPWPLPPVEVTATLAHKFELIGSTKINIKFEKTTVKTLGNLSQLPSFEIPKIPDGLRPPSNSTGSGEFEVTYLDTDMRITRGDRGELRVFVVA